MIPIQQKASLLLWLILPVGAVILYPYLKETPQYLEWLTTGLMFYVLFFSVVTHELSHGVAAYFCGDTTAKDAGRLTFNPVSHISIFGSILVPLGLHLMHAPFVFGWAKPVPFTPTRLRQHPRDQVMLAVAGPLSNFTLAYLCFNTYIFIGYVFNHLFPESRIYMEFGFTPITIEQVPYEAAWFVLFTILGFGMVINVILGVFNLIPFPPLDGSWILKALLPKKITVVFGKIQIFGFVFLIIALQLGLLEIFFYPAMILLGLFQLLANVCLG